MRPKRRSPAAAVTGRSCPTALPASGLRTCVRRQHLPRARLAHREHCVSPACEPSPEEGSGLWEERSALRPPAKSPSTLLPVYRCLSS